MTFDPRWRLICSPDNKECTFVVTVREETRGAAIRLDCAIHFNGFIVNAKKKGAVSIARTESAAEPPKRQEALR